MAPRGRPGGIPGSGRVLAASVVAAKNKPNCDNSEDMFRLEPFHLCLRLLGTVKENYPANKNIIVSIINASYALPSSQPFDGAVEFGARCRSLNVRSLFPVADTRVDFPFLALL